MPAWVWRDVRSVFLFFVFFFVGSLSWPWMSVGRLRDTVPVRCGLCAAWSSVHAWLLRLRTGSHFAPERLPAPESVLHVSAPVRRGVAADARLHLACCPIWLFFFSWGWSAAC